LSRVLPSSFDLAADILVGISSSILVYCLTGALEATGVGLYPAICRKMSGCSYTLYVVHLPILIFLQSWLLSRSRWSPDLLHVCAGIGIAGLVLAYALLVAAVTEDKTDTFRLWLTRRIAQRNRTLMNAGHTSSRTYSIRGQL
jgi:peptidoglycan/LPS O-acetylase OafA/YrhL